MGDGDATIEYVSVIKNIFKLDYGPISTPIIFIKNENNIKGNSTYTQDEAGFLVCNFWYMMAKDEDFLFFRPSSTNVLHP
jgi:hypothetical protein